MGFVKDNISIIIVLIGVGLFTYWMYLNDTYIASDSEYLVCGLFAMILALLYILIANFVGYTFRTDDFSDIEAWLNRRQG